MANRCGTLNRMLDAQQEEGLCEARRKSWGWVLVLGAVSIGGLWSAGDPWIGSWLRAATAQGAASPTHASPIAITSDNRRGVERESGQQLGVGLQRGRATRT